MFSLCIPTMDRFDTFLKGYLEKYITFDLIDEIIICDENGNDYEKIKSLFMETEKIKIHKNENRLGVFFNKLKVCSLAKNEWIVLMDSDNFADRDYFEVTKEYIINNNPTKNSILAPSFAKPQFNYKSYSGMIFNKGNYINNDCFVNTGNYCINKYLIDNLDLSKENENDITKSSSACDCVYLLTLLHEQFDLQLHVVPNLEYQHVVHNGSIYLTTNHENRKFNESIYKRYKSLK